jgi:drug/metabolite transporter (DMT)-like permease
MDKLFETAYAKALLVVAAVFFMCASSLLGEYAWRVSSCDPSFIIFCAETLKLTYSVYSYQKEMKEKGVASELSAAFTLDFWHKARYFGVPAGLYFIINNAAMFALKYIASHLVNMLANIKLLITAALAMMYLKQKISRTQWCALALIAIGMATTVKNPGHKKGDDKGASMLFTLSFGIGTAILSAIAGTFCEKLYKANTGKPAQDNVHIQNVKMYVFGVAFNLLSIMLYGLNSMGGFNYLHVIIIVLMGTQGLMMGFIMKYLNNVVRGIAVAVGSVVSTVASVVLLGNELTGQFVIGGCITLCSAHMYRAFPVPKAVAGDTESGDAPAKPPAAKLPIRHMLVLVPLLLMVVTGGMDMFDNWLHGLPKDTIEQIPAM